LKEAIQDGRLAYLYPGQSRVGEFFGLSRNTVAEVYDRSANDGLVVARYPAPIIPIA
jgi:DNA-binding FadR family transcriptional regulator